ncbi:hypothetical protein IV72_GL001068 [Atopobium minutum]|nr:hypothetical protein HMPREF1247_0668 [Atopobium sp. BV3Ac4]KRN55543.1 hypothetical protein IV72_GL001068 [Atopobium minutum]
MTIGFGKFTQQATLLKANTKVSDNDHEKKDSKSAVDTYGDEAVANYLYNLIQEPSA